jgi:hypothetical protein
MRRLEKSAGGPVGPWVAAWVGGAAIGVANGATRELTYGRVLDEPTANRISALTASTAILGYFAALQRRHPLRSRREAFGVGATWAALTVCFEVGLGRARRVSWQELGAEYDLRRGRLWPLVLLVVVMGPELTRARSCR